VRERQRKKTNVRKKTKDREEKRREEKIEKRREEKRREEKRHRLHDVDFLMEFLKNALRHTIRIVDLFEGKLRAVKLDEMDDSGGASAEFPDNVERVVIDDGDV